MSFQIYNDNCFNAFKLIKNNSIDLFLLDLPYGCTGCVWDIPIDLNKMWKEIKRTIQPNGRIIFFCTAKFGFKLIESNPLWFTTDLIWEKNNSTGFLSSKKCILRRHENIYIFNKNNKDDLQNEFNLNLREYSKNLLNYINKPSTQINKELGHRKAEHFFRHSTTQFSLATNTTYNELIKKYNIDKFKNFIKYPELKSMWAKNSKLMTYNPQMSEGKPYQIKGGKIKPGTIYNHAERTPLVNNGTRYPTSILKFNSASNTVHATQKPIKLLEYLIKTFTNKNDLICDFTMGSGSCGVACINTERRFIGVEKDKAFFEIASNRLNNINI